MELDLGQEIAIATVIAVESFPCSMLGQKKIFWIKSGEQTGNLQLPWNLPMTWIEEQLGSLVRGNLSNGMFKVVDLINPEEPDQIVKVMIDPYLPETLQKAIRAAYDETPAALATIVKSVGSTPCTAGTRMLIFRDGHTNGTIGGGWVESEVRLAALKVIDEEKPCTHKFSLIKDIAALAGMSGGGMLEVFIEPVTTFMQATGVAIQTPAFPVGLHNKRPEMEYGDAMTVFAILDSIKERRIIPVDSERNFEYQSPPPADYQINSASQFYNNF